ncbi:CLUMA_CG005316, isoform A [Clunio marinus]|uniref:Pre-mRNA cleavage complex 2 protein Pcf11 n=1 Tax=Clunio marinus TaxID=568069 RepID=A0A1J1HVT7_9DIPT|nr:CLUMA_CG005316, isoform A [Clunio marinus]
MDQAREKEIEEEYLSSLMDLNVNSKPLINMLTMLAEDNIENAHVIVKAVEMHLAKVSPDVKLPILYLIDSIVKNVGDKYKQLFAQNIVNMFCGVFEKVNEKVREKMFNLRMTWNEVFPQTKLYALDVKVNVLDNNWPITAKVVPKSVHVNPNFLKNQPPPEAQLQTRAQEDLLKQMKEKERELLELKQRKIELELMVTKKKIAESEKEIRSGFVNPSVPVVPVSLVQSTGMPGIMIPPPAQQGRVRIAPVSAGMISTARSRDPRLLRMRQNVPSTTISHSNMPPSIPSPLVSLSGSSLTKSLPRIPKFSQQQTNNKMSRDEERDPRIRKSREDSHSNSMKLNKNNSQNTKSRSSHSSKNSSSKSSERKKSGSSDDTSPRKRNDEEKKSARSSSSHHHKSSIGSKSRSSKSPSKMSPPNNSDSSKDVDLRFNLSSDALMKPDSTTNPTSSKSNKDKLLTDLLNDEDLKSSHDIPSDDNGKENKPILVVTISKSLLKFIVTAINLL